MDCQTVPDKPVDLAEVHLITGENGTGKSRLLSLLATALGQPGPLKNRCPKETLRFATGMRLLTEFTSEPTLTLLVSSEGITIANSQSELLLEMAKVMPALSRTGIAFINEKEQSKKGIYQQSVINNRLLPVPESSYSSGFLPRLQQVIVAARLHESLKMVRLAEQIENVLSEILSATFKFAPKTYPVEEMWVECAIFRKDAPIPISGCPDGLLSLLGWVVDSALVMDEFSSDWGIRSANLQKNEVELKDILPINNDSDQSEDNRNSRKLWNAAKRAFSVKFPLQRIYLNQSAFGGIENNRLSLLFPIESKEDVKSIERPSTRAALEEIIANVFGQKYLLKIELREDLPAPTGSDSSASWGDIANRYKTSESAFDIPCIILLDEIETHLHPSWQWKVLPAFQKMFPKAQIFVATHSPFVIASLNKGMIHRLRRGPDGVVDDARPASEGDSYESALEDIQDVKQRFDPVSEALLDGFYKQRSAALAGDAIATTKARELVKDIARRSSELEDIIGRESRQMERQLKELATK